MKKLQYHLLICIVGVFGLFSFGIYFVASKTLNDGFGAVELRDASLNVQRVREAFIAEQNALTNKMTDWAAWDDTYKFVIDHNEAFVKSNLNASTIANLSASYVIFFDVNGGIVFGKGLNLATKELADLPTDVVDFFKSHTEFSNLKNTEDRIDGFLAFADGVHLVTAQPIVSSEGKGPVHGTVIVTRPVNATSIERISKTVHLDLSMELESKTYSEVFSRARENLSETSNLFVESKSDDEINGYSLYHDIMAKPLFVVRMTEKRAIHQQGVATLTQVRAWLLILSLVGTVIIALALFFLVRSINIKLRMTSDKLAVAAGKIRGTSSSLDASSQKIYSGSLDQKHAIEQTAAASSDMKNMIELIVNEANRSTEITERARGIAVQSSKSSEDLSHRIMQIDQSNAGIADANRQMQEELTQMIKNMNLVNEKTKVIHEIVFQTKILSFNASVEAARAGEAGKGFAVVSEEVGKLAQLSGSAAKEIEQQLTSAVEQMNAFANASREKLDKAINDNAKTVQSGVIAAQESAESVKDIAKQVDILAQALQSILESTKNEIKGINAINDSISQVQQSVSNNQSVAESTSEESQTLSEEYMLLDHSVQDLKKVIG